MAHAKILSHPQRNKIVRMLNRGESVRQVQKFLKEMYPDDRSMHITIPTLQKFRKEKLKIDKDVLDAIKEREKVKDQKKRETKLNKKLNNMSAYKEAIKEAVDLHVDIRTEMKEMFLAVKARLEDLFNRAVSNGLSVNEEANLHKYFSLWSTAIQQWAKYIDQIAEKTSVETNINITVIEDQMSVLRNAVRETIEEEMDAETAMRFMNKLSNKVSELSYRAPKSENFVEIKKQNIKLSGKIKDAEVDDAD